MITLLAATGSLFHTAAGAAFADLMIDGHRETWPIHSKPFRAWLRRRYYQATQGALSAGALRSALDLLEARAQFDAPERAIHVRVAAHGMGETAPVLLRDLNAPLTVCNRIEAVRAALELAVAPVGWADDLAVLLALAPADDARVREAAERLARGVLGLLRERAPGVG